MIGYESDLRRKLDLSIFDISIPRPNRNPYYPNDETTGAAGGPLP